MNTTLNATRKTGIALVCTLGFTLSGHALAAKVVIPNELIAEEMSPQISYNIKSALETQEAPCGLGNEHTQHDHAEPVKKALLARDGTLTADSARKLIFSKNDLTLHQLLSLIENLGVMNASNTDALLRNIHKHAPALAERFADVEEEDKNLRANIINSNVEDIQHAVIQAIGQNKSQSLRDIVVNSARGQSHMAIQAQHVLKQL